MPTLFVLTGKLVGRTFEVRETALLGRGDACGVRLPDASVSREHARLERDEEGDWWVVDLGSRNGIRVNGEREERALLKDLDEVLLGELLVRFRTDAPAPAPEIAPAIVEPAKPAPAPTSVTAPADGGFELEEEIELGETRATPRAGVRLAGEPPPAPRPAIELTGRDRGRARILSESHGGGLMTGDLSQWPAPLRWGAYLFAVALTTGLCYGIYVLILAMRGV
jgi:hypothetical protein